MRLTKILADSELVPRARNRSGGYVTIVHGSGLENCREAVGGNRNTAKIFEEIQVVDREEFYSCRLR
jgi:hypothetical protein